MQTKEDFRCLQLLAVARSLQHQQRIRFRLVVNIRRRGRFSVCTAIQQFSKEEQREIVFKDITTGEITHSTILDTAGVADYRSVLGRFTQTIMGDLRLISGYDALYGKVKEFVRDHLFSQAVDLESLNTLRNLSELAATKYSLTDPATKAHLCAELGLDSGIMRIADSVEEHSVAGAESGFGMSARAPF